MDGWIKLHRKVLESEVAGDMTALGLWSWCLLKANHDRLKWQGMTVERGQFFTGRKSAAIETGLAETTWRDMMRRFEKWGYLRQEPASRGTMITIINYDSYQQPEPDARQMSASNPPAARQQSASNPPAIRHKQEPRTKNQEPRTNGGRAASVPKRFASPTVQEVSEYCQSRSNGIDAQQFIDFYESRGWKLSRGVAMKDWRAAVRTWERRSNTGTNGRKYTSEEVPF